MKRWVVGDVHGRYKELKATFVKAGVDYENDEVIFLGDIVDRGPEPFKCMFEIMNIKHAICVRGNHDFYLKDYVEGYQHFLNGNHGSATTIVEYKYLNRDEVALVKSFLKNQIPYHIDKENRLFVHGGFDRWHPIDIQHELELCQTREFWNECLYLLPNPPKKIANVEDFAEIYIGHTPTIRYKKVGELIEIIEKDTDEVITTPINISNVWNLDTGAGFIDGALTVMNIETKEYFQTFINDKKL